MNLSKAAIDKLAIMLKDEDPDTKLRVYIIGGGCNGFSYGFDFTTSHNEDDFVLETEPPLIVDALSFQYLDGSEIDYKETIMESRFVINNPNASTTCGCGSSFSI